MPRAKRLLWVDEAPPVLQYNPFIRSGYRAGYSRRECACSILQYHNETGNIWSHLVPLVSLATGICTGAVQVWPGPQWVFWTTAGPILLCFLGSVGYHTLMAHHPRYKLYLTLDVCGIFVLMLASAPVTLGLGFRGWAPLQAAFLAAYYSAAALCVYRGLTATRAADRALPMLGLLLVRVAALALRLALAAGSQPALRLFMASEALSVSGAVVNVLRVPERLFQPRSKRAAGPFDYWLNSHQLMHLLTLGALWCYFWGARREQQHWLAAH